MRRKTLALTIPAVLTAALLTASPATAAEAHHHCRPRLLAHDDFRHGTAKWTAELEAGGTVTASHGVLDIDVPAGATVWFERELTGPYVIEYTAVPVDEGGPNDRVSDLNTFWSARDVRSPGDIFATPRGGALPEYDNLTTYYVGFGGNYNTSTRMRRYVGVPGERPLLFDRAEPLLTPNEPHRIRQVVSGNTVQYWVNGRLLFDHTDAEPYGSGWFAFRTVWSHLAISDFTVRRPGCR